MAACPVDKGHPAFAYVNNQTHQFHNIGEIYYEKENLSDLQFAP